MDNPQIKCRWFCMVDLGSKSKMVSNPILWFN